MSKRYVKRYSEFYKYLNKTLKEIRPLQGEPLKLLMKRKLTASYQIVINELKGLLEALRDIESSGDFYIELFKAFTGLDVSNLVVNVKSRLNVAKKVYSWTLDELKEAETRKDIIRAFKAGVGRLLSIYRRIYREVALVKEFLKEVSKMPDVRGDYVIVIAGVPQVGKSTILSKLTSAKPEIGTYPFTTKTLIAGHIDIEPYGRIVLVDSPGILDTPIEEKNIIEYKAVLAIKHLADHVLFVFAYSPDFYYTLREQLNVYESIKRLLGDKPITVLLNKVDLLEQSELDAILREIEACTGVKPLPISALTGYNLDYLKKYIVDVFMERKRSL
jgi:nucleolar GTP-binding protein